jgi:hypothetical protein
MQANEEGHHIDFQSGHYSTSILHMVQNEESGDFEIVKRFYGFNEHFNFDEAEAYLKGLIEDVHT